MTENGKGAGGGGDGEGEEMSVVRSSNVKELDAWVDSLLDCQPLPEADVKHLCDLARLYVHIIYTEFCQFRTKLHLKNTSVVRPGCYPSFPSLRSITPMLTSCSSFGSGSLKKKAMWSLYRAR